MKAPKFAILLYRCTREQPETPVVAEVLAVDCLNMAPYGRNAKRLCQRNPSAAVAFADGMGACGVIVRTAHYLGLGDSINEMWTEGSVGRAELVIHNSISRCCYRQEV